MPTSETKQPTPDVTILPGVPNMTGLTVDDGVIPFPDTTADVVKLLRQRGFSVEYSVPRNQRIYVGHKAFELWLPILEFTRDLLISIEAGLLVELLKSFVQPAADPIRPKVLERGTEDDVVDPEDSTPAILHVEWHVAKPDGERQIFVANGSMPDVLDALARFEQNVRDDDRP